ncbi:MAG TPA: DUF6089 family protein [Cyclobacteriaceae bacterium]|nr:DUF6089 family protein [Cyclobacteriaceae bacterium]
MRITFLLLLLVGLGSEIAVAQSFYAIRRERSIIGSIGTGVSSYYGDLKEEKRSIDPKPTVNVGMQYFFTPRLSVRAELTWFQLTGDDSKAENIHRVNRNLSFTANNFELSATGAINLMPNGIRFYQRAVFNTYVFGGAGLLYSNPKAELNGEKHALQPLQTEGVAYSKFQPVLPYGFGMRVMINPFFNIAIEGSHRVTFTDYLDDVSTVHPDKTGWTDPVRIALSDRRGELGLSPYEAGARRGNPDNNDSYFLITLKLEYYIPDNVFWNSNNKLYRAKRKSLKRR